MEASNNTEIVQLIKEKLLQIEERENIRILYACESGSRAWGFASPDSDYDVRFIYVRPKEFYLKLENTRDTLECELNEIYDISGWDLKKMLRLLNRSNPSIFEWAASPLVYKTTKEWDYIKQFLKNHFSETKALYHYNSITKNNIRRYFNDTIDVRYKPYLYNLRQCLSCEWILDRKSPPPIVFDILKEKYLPEEIQNSVNNLLELKKSMKEKETGPRITEIDLYIDSVVSKVEKYLEKPAEKRVSEWDELNRMFLKLLEGEIRLFRNFFSEYFHIFTTIIKGVKERMMQGNW